jgi:hypothetical protein
MEAEYPNCFKTFNMGKKIEKFLSEANELACFKRKGIENFCLEYLRMQRDKSPAPPVLRYEGHGIRPLIDNLQGRQNGKV